jgi:hypothetical protein
MAFFHTSITPPNASSLPMIAERVLSAISVIAEEEASQTMYVCCWRIADAK